jgi:DNA recombination protein Rad52
MTDIAAKLASPFDEEQITWLREPLARNHVKSRQQAGRTLSYIEGWVAISEANRIFGFGGWDRETVECRCISERETMMGANKDRPGWRVAYVARVRITVRASGQAIIREGTGYGSGIDADDGAAHESAVKEAETDAMKRGLMTFGNPFGLALYDKTQAEVEPVASRPRTPAAPQQQERNATNGAGPGAAGDDLALRSQFEVEGKGAPLTPAEAAAHPNERERKVLAAREARKRITEALGVARTPAIIDEVIEINSAALEEIKDLHAPSYEAIMALSVRLKGELYGATG